MATVQILMAVYNGEEYLSAQIDSILGQTFEDWELLISDDGSTDGSLGVIRHYCSCDPRVHLVLDGERFGCAKKHFMALLRLASSRYVMTCDQDDVWDSDKVELTFTEMQRREDTGKPVLVCTDLRVVDRELNELSPSFLTYSGMDASKLDMGYFLASCLVTGCTMMVNQPLLSLLQRPVDEDRIVMHDWWASLVAAAMGEVAHIDRATISYRQHGDNSVGAEHFTVSSALAALDQKRETERGALAQASELKRLFPDLLTAEQSAQVDAFLAVEKAAPISRIGLLSKAGVWRHGFLRNAGTLLTFMTLGNGR